MWQSKDKDAAPVYRSNRCLSLGAGSRSSRDDRDRAGWLYVGQNLEQVVLVIDKAWNCTLGQVKMLLTRLGWNSTMVVMGDPDQTYLLQGMAGL